MTSKPTLAWGRTPGRLMPPPPRQPRERAVPCGLCRTPTWNPSALCDRHTR